MNKIFWFLIAFIVLMFAFLFAVSQYEDDSDPASSSFEYTKQCYNKQCLFLDNLLINKLRSNKKAEEIENEFNQFLEDNTNLSLVKAKYTEEYGCQLTAFNSIDYNAKYLEYNLSNVIHENIINKEYFKNNVNLEQLTNDQKIYQSWKINSQIQKVIVNILYHFTHLENSIFKPWIQTLPNAVYPLYYNLTFYELKLIEGDNVHQWVLQLVDQYTRDYKTLIQLIRKKDNTEQQFFNGYTLQLQDYVYARYMCDIYGWNMQNKSQTTGKKDQKQLFIVPGINCLAKQAPEITLKYENLHILDNNQFQCYSDREFKYNEVVKENYEIQDNSIIFVNICFFFINFQSMLGVTPNDNPFDCIQTQIYDPEYFLLSYQGYVMQIAQFLGGQNAFLCLPPKINQFDSIKQLGNYMNYNATMKKYFYDLLAKEQNSFEKLKQIKKWPSVRWTKYNPLEVPLGSLENQIKFYSAKFNNATEYYNLRQRKGKSILNAERIKKYFEIKVNLAERVKELLLQVGKDNINQFSKQKQQKNQQEQQQKQDEQQKQQPEQKQKSQNK